MTEPANTQDSPHVLIVAYACHPDATMETRLGWRRAVDAAQKYNTTVLHSEQYDSEELARRAAADGVERSRLRFVPVGSTLLRWTRPLDVLYWAGYRAWQHAALVVARDIHRRHPIHIVHQVSYCGYREPGEWWRLGVPLVWGPVGGTQNFPWRFRSLLGRRAGVRELARNAVNGWQLRSRRVRQSACKSTAVFTANSVGQRDLQQATGVACHRLLETAVDAPPDAPHRELDTSRPFRLLWSGRLREWKALPILLQALAKCHADFSYQLRVLGAGSSERRWRRLATRLGVADRIEWVGWPEYQDSLPHYGWADACAFTSLRDTSGTGLLEALAAGTPIIGVDHQGAGDIMTPACALPVSVDDPTQTIHEFSAAIERLAGSADLWRSLSRGAWRRARHFSWDRLAREIDAAYQTALANQPILQPVASRRPSSPESSAGPTNPLVTETPVASAN